MKLLVPVDGSAASHRAVDHALWLAQGRAEASLTLLNVQSRETLDISDIDVEAAPVDVIAARESAKVLQPAIKACEAAGVRFETRAEFGPICDTILRVAHDTHADQIVMGSRGLGRLGSALLGSVVTEVIHAATVPVTVVKETTRVPAPAPAAEATTAKTR